VKEPGGGRKSGLNVVGKLLWTHVKEKLSMGHTKRLKRPGWILN
jgi:hypothetical protein